MSYYIKKKNINAKLAIDSIVLKKVYNYTSYYIKSNINAKLAIVSIVLNEIYKCTS